MGMYVYAYEYLLVYITYILVCLPKFTFFDTKFVISKRKKNNIEKVMIKVN